MIREMTRSDFEAFWPCFESIIKARESYAFDPEINLAQAYQLWCETPLESYVYVEQGQVLGTYYLKANAMGPGNHICNCGYMVNTTARGKGIARKLCLHSQQMAIKHGFQAMQFNAVVSTNEVAVKLWQKLGFNIVGTIPLAYHHASLGYVDSYIMYKLLPH